MNRNPSESWRQPLQDWAERVWRQFMRRPEVLGLALGGSIGRGLERPGSDLELGILVEEIMPECPYFQVIEGRGVEAIQIVRKEVEERIRLVAADATASVDWPLPLWRCRVVHDPTGLLARFRDVFDSALAEPATLLRQKEQSLAAYLAQREKITAALDEGQPLRALVVLRDAFNALVCAAFWHYGRIPRSQNRTHERLSALCAAHRATKFLAAFEAIYGLPVDPAWARQAAAACSEQRHQAIAHWGPNTQEFFRCAVDPELESGDLQGIVTVHRLYIPMIKGEGLHDPAWRQENAALLAWLDLEHVTAGRVQKLLNLADTAHASLLGPLAIPLDSPLA